MTLGSSESNIHSNLLFVVADIMETLLMDTNSLLEKDGFELRHEAKRNFKTAVSSVRKLKGCVGHCSEQTQDFFGNDSDMIYQTIKLLIDRCGNDDMKLFKFYNYIKSFPSQLKLENIDDSVFNVVLKNKEE